MLTDNQIKALMEGLIDKITSLKISMVDKDLTINRLRKMQTESDETDRICAEIQEKRDKLLSECMKKDREISSLRQELAEQKMENGHLLEQIRASRPTGDVEWKIDPSNPLHTHIGVKPRTDAEQAKERLDEGADTMPVRLNQSSRDHAFSPKIEKLIVRTVMRPWTDAEVAKERPDSLEELYRMIDRRLSDVEHLAKTTSIELAENGFLARIGTLTAAGKAWRDGRSVVVHPDGSISVE